MRNMESKEMEKKVGKRFNPFTDYGFKKIFGTDPNKDLLIDFINGVLKGERVVTDVTYVKSERLPESINGKIIFIDVICTGDDGSTFVVEMQRSLIEHLLQRMLFYGCRLISEQEHRGGVYDLRAVYVICLLEMEIKDNPNLRSDYSIVRVQDGVMELNELKISLFQLGRFNKAPEECLTIDDKWLYLLKNLEYMERLPKEIQSKLTDKLMSISEIESMSPEERAAYDKSMMEYEGLRCSLDYARKEGKIEEKKQIARTMKSEKISIDVISKCTGLSVKEIEVL